MRMMKQERIKQLLWFTGGAICGLAMLSISKASVPNLPSSDIPTGVTNDSAIYQQLSDIQVSKDSVPSFDGDISRLSRMEGRYRDQLPGLSRSRRAMNRVARQQYRYRGNTGAVSAWNEVIPVPSR